MRVRTPISSPPGEWRRDIAHRVPDLCSDEAGSIAGENIRIDGGWTRQMIYHDDWGWTLRGGESE